jgi:cytochrome b561
MNRRDVAQLMFRAVALWFGLYGAGLVAIAATVWHEDGASVGLASLGVAVAFIMGAVAAWVVAPRLSARVFSAREEPTPGLTREDLWSTVVFGIGVFLLAGALPRLAYWLMVSLSASGNAFWSNLTGWRTDDGVVYSVAFRGQLAEVVTQLVLGVSCVLGPESVARALARLRARLFRTALDARGHTPPSGQD